MGLTGLVAAGLRTATGIAERLENPHGPWCEPSRPWMPDSSDARVVPIRIGDEHVAMMFSEDGWEADIAAVFMRGAGDGTFQMFFREAEDVDLSSNRVVQRMLMSALDLAQALDSSNCDLSDEVVEFLSEFKKAARSRRINVQP